MIYGEVIGILRNKDTLIIEGEFSKKNIITNQAFDLLTQFTSTGVSGNICVSVTAFAPTRFIKNIQGSIFSGATIPSHANPDFFPAVGAVAAYAQWTVRILPQAASVSINTIFLCDFNPVTIATGPRAYTKLSVPCIQTNTQVLDVYYRIYFPIPAVTEVNTYTYNEIAKTLSYGIRGSGPYSRAGVSALPSPALLTYQPGQVLANTVAGGVASPGGGLSKGPLNKIKHSQNFALTDLVGVMMAEFQYTSLDASLTGNITPIQTQKIQNMIGHGAGTKRPFLDIDFLPTSTGLITPSGVWNNKNNPINAGMYYGGLLPEVRRFNITTAGAVGVAAYNYTKRKCFGFGLANYNAGANPDFNNYNSNSFVKVSFLHEEPLSAGASIYGDHSGFGVRQLSATIPYDNASVIIVQTLSVMVSNIANGAYWLIKGGFTNAHQVALVNGVIYIACYATGLWSCDPRVTTTPTSLAAPAVGVDLSLCFGVAKGFNNTIWAVGNNGLMQFDGVSTWTKHDAASTQPFVMIGVSDSNWNKIDYLKVDAGSPNNNMLLIRRLDAPVNGTSLGVWWSTTTAAINAGNESISGGGAPRLNRSHLAVSPTNGFWAMHSGSYVSRLTFGTVAIDNIYTNSYNYGGLPLNSIKFVKSQAGTDVLLRLDAASSYDNLFSTRPSTYNPDLSLNTAGTAFNIANFQTNGTVIPYSYGLMQCINSGIYPSYGNSDVGISLLLDNGVIFYLARCDTAPVMAYVQVYPFDSSNTGGPLAYLGETTYGWNGSAWVAGTSTSKITHAVANTLDDAISIKFNAGATEPSFVATDFFTCVLCEGLLKDNVTTNSIENSFYFKKVYKNSTLLNNVTIPAPIVGYTGVQALDVGRCSSAADISQNGTNQIVFAYGNPDQGGVGLNQLTGDFVIRYDITASLRSSLFGVGSAGTNMLAGGWAIDQNGGIYLAKVYYAGQGPTILSTLNYATGTGATTRTVGDVAALLIARIGTKLRYYIGDLNTEVNTDASIGNAGILLPAGQLVLDTLCTPMINPDTGLFFPVPVVSPVCNIVSNGTISYVKLGTGASGTGAYNPLFYCIDTDARGGISGTINSIPLTAVHVDGSLPAVGEVTVDTYTGTLIYNAADQGKPITINCLYMTHE